MLKCRRVFRVAVALAVGVACGSCMVTRNIPEDKLLLRKVKVEKDRTTPESERIPTTTLEKYVRQTPNKRLFGFNFYIWIHNLANPDKENWWNDLKRKVGEAPVYFDTAQTLKSEDNIKLYMNSQGYYASQTDYRVDTIARRRRARVTYTTRQGKPYLIKRLEYQFRDSLLTDLITRDTVNSLIHTGDIFSVALLDLERERITKSLQNRGYYDFTVNNIVYRADTLAGDNTVDLSMIVRKNLTGYDARGNALYNNNIRYRVGEVNILPSFDSKILISDTTFLKSIDTLHYRGLNIITNLPEPNVRPKVLRQMVPMQEGQLYSSGRVEQTYQNLMSLGYFKSARISFQPMEIDAQKRDSLEVMALKSEGKAEAQRRANPDTPLDRYLSSYILCSPALKQSYNVELEGSTTSSFYGLYGTVGYENRNIFRGAEAWNIEFTMGYEHMKAPDAVKRRATEIGVSTGFSFPRFMIPFVSRQFTRVVQPKTEVELSVNLQDRPYYERTLSGASWSYSWRNKGYSSYMVRPVDINLINMKYISEEYFDALENDYLRNSYETQLIAGINLGYAYNNQRKNLGGNSTMLRINAETAGNSISAFKKLVSSSLTDGESYEVLGIRYAQYVRGDISVSRKYVVGERSAIASRIYMGGGTAYGNSSAIPFDRLFYSGGSNSMRGWTPRTLGPGSSEEVEDAVYPSQLGDMKLEANVEFRFPLWESFHGATFFDAGNVWYLKDSEGVYDQSALFDRKTFYKQLGFNTGLGVRLDIQFAVLRLDWGIQLHNPNKLEGERWVIKHFNLNNTALNFGVGYPF
ncbi:MAG: BamA/TamA family outer membrane protein [Rikenellaceae bacterium]